MESIKNLFKIIFDVIKNSTRDSIGAYSAQAAFFITVSFFPLIMLLISMLGVVPLEGSEIIGYVIGVFPKGMRAMVESFVTDAYNNSGVALISITAVTTLWAASIGIYSLVKGIDRIYCGEQTRNSILLRLLSMVYTLFIMALFVICLCVFVFGNTIVEGLLSFIPQIMDVALIVMSVRMIVGVVVLGAFFLLMYTLIPNKKLSFWGQWPGALLSAAGWVGFSGIFSYYFESLSNFSYVYGSLSVMVFFMLWLFFCIYILFIGAEVNKSLLDRKERAALFNREEKTKK